MIPAILKTKEANLRTAVARCQYADLPSLVLEMRRIAQEEIAANESFRGEIAAMMLGVIEWAQLMVASQRQIWADESAMLPNISRYLTEEPAVSAGSWQL